MDFRPLADYRGTGLSKERQSSLNNSNAMKAVHAALATRPTGMVATTSTSRTIYIPRSQRAPS